MKTAMAGAALVGFVGTAMLVGVAFGQSVAMAGNSGHPSAPVLAGIATEDPTGDGVTVEFVTDTLDRAIAEGIRHAGEGRYGQALEAFHRASALAVQLGAVAQGEAQVAHVRHRLVGVRRGHGAGEHERDARGERRADDASPPGGGWLSTLAHGSEPYWMPRSSTVSAFATRRWRPASAVLRSLQRSAHHGVGADGPAARRLGRFQAS